MSTDKRIVNPKDVWQCPRCYQMTNPKICSHCSAKRPAAEPAVEGAVIPPDGPKHVPPPLTHGRWFKVNPECHCRTCRDFRAYQRGKAAAEPAGVDFERLSDSELQTLFDLPHELDERASIEIGQLRLRLKEYEPAAETAGHPPDAIERLLAKLYRIAPCEVAKLCDEYIDRSGALLGRVRTAAEPAGMTPAEASAQYRLGYVVGYDTAAAGERNRFAATVASERSEAGDA